MRDPCLKECVLVVALLPVAVMQLAFGYIQLRYYHLRYLVAKCHRRCDEYMVSRLELPKPLDVLVEKPQTHEPQKQTSDMTADDFMEWIWGLKADQIALIRQAGESIGIGPDVVATHPDRHLYSVLRPSKYENYRRIRNLVYHLQPDIQRRFLADMAELIQQR